MPSVRTSIATSDAIAVVARPSDSPFSYAGFSSHSFAASTVAWAIRSTSFREAFRSACSIARKRRERADSAVCVDVFEDFATCFGELGREFFGVVVDLAGFLADSVGETFCELFGGFSKARLRRWRR
jgi:hypothetical protein